MVIISRYLYRYSFIGLVFAGLFLLLSMTPSLLPRSWPIQGVLSGAALVSGYGVGVLLSAVYRYLELPEPAAAQKTRIRQVVAAAFVFFLAWFIYRAAGWNQQVIDIVGATKESAYSIKFTVVALVVGWSVLAIARQIRRFFRANIDFSLKRLPPKLAVPLGFVVGLILLDLIFSGLVMRGLVAVANYSFSGLDTQTDPGVEQPSSSLRSGSPDSLVRWDSLGRQGRNFVAGGPSTKELEEFAKAESKHPIRVYAGLKSADTVEARAQLALDELKRTGAFERKVLVVATTTGTGWLDPNAVDTLEYIHHGDTAIVGLQYSYLPSWISLFVDQQITAATSQATLRAVHGYWSELDDQARPRLYVFGLSLGAFGSQDSANDLRLVNDSLDGALWVGPPFFSQDWQRLTATRDVGSPAYLPIVDQGHVVRFTGRDNALDRPDGKWGKTRYVYLQHANDPIVFFSPDLLFNRPDWLRPDQRSPDVTPDMKWYPLVTFWQVAVDVPTSGRMPAGQGHKYAPESYIDSWLMVTRPEDWDDAQTAVLKASFGAD